ncbi:hydantoinase B/oxoprolinase family protein [Roseateles sp. DAIF2]|uniref:hydantoinase B/oxoprolinase family protein n=1 Tax=Roseateles sp. DAIF2 TaxID=2714952 RepID=UPI0018A2A1E8|nr:hydantoinase B/oxoprolinase family protein [Roseateles sp. DAIF2]QPF74110.1 hydantoinase B/oxoprolinase family protein [Roseateles sp. DAIF2]
MSEQTLRWQLMWTRLLAVVEEQAQTLVRTAFGTATREAGDLSAGVFLPDGRMLAQAVTGTPGHVNAMAGSVAHFLREFPAETMRAGDAYLSNDPWLCTGHLFDMTLVSPVFDAGGRLLALFASTLHVVDIGGIGPGPDASEIFHEGLFIPILRYASAAGVDRGVRALIRANVRYPDEVEGDLAALRACNEVGARRLAAMLAEFGEAALEPLGGFIIERSRRAMEQAIAAWPRGVYRHRLQMDGFDGQTLSLQAELRLLGERIEVDYAGSAAALPRGINVPLPYTEAYTSFGLRCLIGAGVPNNAGSLAAIRVEAPSGSILNAPPPHAVNARHVTGQLLPDLMFGCLRQARPEAVPAEGAASLWNINLAGQRRLEDGGRRRFAITSFSTGGTGGRPRQDGLSTTAFPSGVRNVSIEILEASAPLLFWRKEYRPDSGGAGRQRGGLGQVIEVQHAQEDEPLLLAASWERWVHAPRGAEGGADGATGSARLLPSGEALRGKGRQTIPAGQRLQVLTPGGAGLGPAAERDPAALAADLRAGLVSPAAARAAYGAIPQHNKEDL